jgi:aerobic-type carbon monoxide dehydrogenase small subunit (CoxS/CutS family)
MSSITLTVNGRTQTVDVEPDTPLLWVLRDTLGLTGTKYGCGKALCGACTVHVNRNGSPSAVRSCVIPASALAGADVTTIEGLSALLAGNPRPDDQDIDVAMRGVLCRCGTHLRIRRAIHRAAGGGGDR